MATTRALPGLAARSKLFRGFADPSRLGILDALRSGPRSVGDLVEHTGLSQSNVSNHLSCLLDCGLVGREQRGRYAYYALADPRVAELLSLSDRLIADVAEGFYACTRYDLPAGERPRE
jgi:DNA-binding transcriptional ArsR family regulator